MQNHGVGLRLRSTWLSRPRTWRYVMVGGCNTAVGYVLFAALYLGLGEKLPYWCVLAMCHFMAVSFSFITQRYLVFVESYRHPLSAFLAFHGSYLWLAPQGIGVNWGLVHFVGWSPWGAQAFAMVTGIFTAYFLHRYLVFRNAE